MIIAFLKCDNKSVNETLYPENVPEENKAWCDFGYMSVN